jgi:ketosteroid isomerase-like protein
MSHDQAAQDQAAQDQAAQDQAAVRRLEDERYQALERGDIDAFAALCHPDLLYTHSTGGTDTLADYLGKLREGYYVYHRIDHPVRQVGIYGEVALVFGEMNADITAGGISKQLRTKCLAAWARSGTGWLLLAYQPTPIPQP